MENVSVVLVVIAILFFLAAGFGVKTRVGLGWIGLAVFAAAFLPWAEWLG